MAYVGTVMGSKVKLMHKSVIPILICSDLSSKEIAQNVFICINS